MAAGDRQRLSPLCNGYGLDLSGGEASRLLPGELAGLIGTANRQPSGPLVFRDLRPQTLAERTSRRA